MAVQYAYVTNGSQGDLLSTNLSLVTPTTLTVPLNGGKGAYDPALVYDAAHTRYLLAYTINNDFTLSATTNTVFYPALAYASTPTGTWTLIAADTRVLGNWEGTNIENVNGTFYVMAGGPRFWPNTNIPACNASRVYNSTLTYIGAFLGAKFASASDPSSLPCPHPSIFAHPDGIHTVLFTFDQTLYPGDTVAGGQPLFELTTP